MSSIDGVAACIVAAMFLPLVLLLLGTMLNVTSSMLYGRVPGIAAPSVPSVRRGGLASGLDRTPLRAIGQGG